MKLDRARVSTILACVAGITLSKSASAATRYVDDDKRECPSAAYRFIQAAVNAASPGDTIKVCPGTYREQVTIPTGKDNIFLGSTVPYAAIIEAPSGMADEKAIVRVRGARYATICSFTITGPGEQECDSLRYGVLVDAGGSATIRQNYITQIQDDVDPNFCPNGVGIQVGNPANGTTGTATLLDNTIDHYQLYGIDVLHAGSNARIIGNDITGDGAEDEIGQEGIFVLAGATAHAAYNTVRDNAAGIFLEDAGSGIYIERNRFEDNNVGIYIVLTDYATVKYNAIRGNGNGIDLIADNHVQVLSNTVSHSEFVGIFADRDARDNTITGNKISFSGRYDAEDDSVGRRTGGTANYWDNNLCSSPTEENRPGLCE